MERFSSIRSCTCRKRARQRLKKAPSLTPPSGAPRRIGAIVDEESSGPQFDCSRRDRVDYFPARGATASSGRCEVAGPTEYGFPSSLFYRRGSDQGTHSSPSISPKMATMDGVFFRVLAPILSTFLAP